MTDSKLEKVYLLPRTIEHYQKELTRMLEFERYGEAADTLRFLLGCETGDAWAAREWQVLLDWIVTMFPEIREGNAEEEPDLTEEDLFRLHLKERTAQDPGYAEKLLEVFRSPEHWEKQVLALEQLRYLDHPEIEPVLLRWLRTHSLPPSLQFRALQILKLRGSLGAVKLRRQGQTQLVEIGDVPTHVDEYPLPFQEIIERVNHFGAREGIPLVELAGQTWGEFIAYSFGTPLYTEVLSASLEAWDAWAAAFHHMLLLTAQGEADPAVIKDLYGITSSLDKEYNKALKVFKDFARTVFPSF
ncbi:hypothetical protein [Gorillibacterium sp. sgz5001074]|uniref:hypothetical protein n=1 Tax=Gorillibacterium sp. sgz5001074 TaxID=3446695 RepID=UPI003F675035